MYPFCFTLDKRQSIGQKRTGSRAKQQPTGKPIVPHPERLNEIFPAAKEVRDCPSEEEDGNVKEEEEPALLGSSHMVSDLSSFSMIYRRIPHPPPPPSPR